MPWRSPCSTTRRRSGSARACMCRRWLTDFGFIVVARSPPTRLAAAFAFAVPEEVGRLDRFAQGTADYPDRSTTLVLQVGVLAGEGSGSMRLTGPGIETARTLSVPDVPGSLWEELAVNADRFPARRRSRARAPATGWPPCRAPRAWRAADGLCRGQGRRAGDRQRASPGSPRNAAAILPLPELTLAQIERAARRSRSTG